MKKITVLATVLTLGATATSVGAFNTKLSGSDTLKDFTRKIIPTCAGATTLIYNGGGSGTGETAIIGGAQELAPMSRFLGAAVCRAATPGQAQSRVVAFDGLGIASSAVDGCGTSPNLAFTGSFTVKDVNGNPVVNCPGCDAGTSTYTFQGLGGAADTANAWKDVLRIVFGGMDHTAGSAIANQKCAGDVRRTLVNSYGTLFQGGCAGATCTQLTHAFRRDDLSGTTDTFVTLLGMLAASGTAATADRPFCNGSEQEDKDPIRRACRPEDDVCNKDGSLGLVLPMFAPPNPTTADSLYVTDACSPSNKTKILPCQKTVDTGGTSHFQCPDRADADEFNIAGGNIAPVTDAGGPCVCNTDPGLCKTVFMKPAMDHRVYNLFSRIPNGNIVVNQPPADPDDPTITKRTFPATHAFYRLRSATVNGAKAAGTLCQNNDDTSNIGCASAQGSCSIGFAGRESIDLTFIGQTGGTPGSRPIGVNNRFPTDSNVLGLLYPLSRKLYLASVVGFGNLTDPPEQALASTTAGCYGNVATVQAAATTFGYVPLQAGTTAESCEDFNEQSICNNLAQPACTAATEATTCGSMGKCRQSASHGTTCAAGDTSCVCIADCTGDLDCSGGRTCIMPTCTSATTAACGPGNSCLKSDLSAACAAGDTGCLCSAKQCKFSSNSASCP